MKRKWTTFLRIFRYGLNNFSRNTWLTTAATAVMTVTLLIIMSTIVARMVFADTIQQIRQKIDASVYLKDGIAPEEIERFTNDIKHISIVTSVRLITKEEARANFQQSSSDLAQLQALGELGDNPFPASLKIKTKDPNKLEDLNKVINNPEYKRLQSDPPSYSGERKAAIDKIAQVSQYLETGGLAAAILFVLISVMIIFNTIRMAIFNRKDEIEMMKLIGAEKRFIRGPFIIEASLYGILAAAVSIILMYILLLTRAGDLARGEIVIDPTIHFFMQWPILIIVGQTLVGVLIGIFSSLLAIRRYLKL